MVPAFTTLPSVQPTSLDGSLPVASPTAAVEVLVGRHGLKASLFSPNTMTQSAKLAESSGISATPGTVNLFAVSGSVLPRLRPLLALRLNQKLPNSYLGHAACLPFFLCNA